MRFGNESQLRICIKRVLSEVSFLNSCIQSSAPGQIRQSQQPVFSQSTLSRINAHIWNLASAGFIHIFPLPTTHRDIMPLGWHKDTFANTGKSEYRR